MGTLQKATGQVLAHAPRSHGMESFTVNLRCAGGARAQGQVSTPVLDRPELFSQMVPGPSLQAAHP